MPIPTYMSGLVFKTDTATDELIDQCFAIADGANSYPHMDLVLSLLDRGNLAAFYSEMFVIKGEQTNYGGDSHAHKVSSSDKNLIQCYQGGSFHQEINQDLNPSIFAPEARMGQFNYRMIRMNCLRRAGPFAKNIGFINLLVFYATEMLASPSVVRLPVNTQLSAIVKHALERFPKSTAFPKFWLQAVYFVIRFNLPFGIISLKALRLFLKLTSKATLMLFIR